MIDRRGIVTLLVALLCCGLPASVIGEPDITGRAQKAALQRALIVVLGRHEVLLINDYSWFGNASASLSSWLITLSGTSRREPTFDRQSIVPAATHVACVVLCDHQT